MPLPIQLIGNGDSQNSYNELAGRSQMFDEKPYDELAYAQKFFANEKPSNDSIKLLELIDKHDDGIVNAAVNAITKTADAKYKTVPDSISDNALLNLKTQGYVTGAGRSVTFTEKGTKALASRYLGSENLYKSQRVKKKII